MNSDPTPPLVSKTDAFIERLRGYGRFYLVPVDATATEVLLDNFLRQHGYTFSIPILPGETLEQAMQRKPFESFPTIGLQPLENGPDLTQNPISPAGQQFKPGGAMTDGPFTSNDETPPCIGDDGPMTSGDCARWLEAKYSRHGELEDRASAQMIRNQASEIHRLRAIIAGNKQEPFETNGWQSIEQWESDEQAPVEVLVAHPTENNRFAVGEAKWHGEKDGWYWSGNDPTDSWGHRIYPTHWQPLPAPPTSLKANEPATECRICEMDGAFKCYAHNRTWGNISNATGPCPGWLPPNGKADQT